MINYTYHTKAFMKKCLKIKLQHNQIRKPLKKNQLP